MTEPPRGLVVEGLDGSHIWLLRYVGWVGHVFGTWTGYRWCGCQVFKCPKVSMFVILENLDT